MKCNLTNEKETSHCELPYPICEKPSLPPITRKDLFPSNQSNPPFPSPPSWLLCPFHYFLRLSQTFDREKYTHLRADAPNNNNNNAASGKDKTLVGLRIDDKGGIYLQVNETLLSGEKMPHFSKREA